jgi:hypothetical protein
MVCDVSFITRGSIRVSHWTTEIRELFFFEFLALDCDESESYLKRKFFSYPPKVCHNVCYACRNTIAADAWFNTSPAAQGMDVCIAYDHCHPFPHFERSTHRLIITAKELWEVISRIRGKLGT